MTKQENIGKPEGISINKNPSWMKELPDDMFEIETRKGTYKLQILKKSEYRKAEKLAKATGRKQEEILVTKSAVEPKITDADYDDMRADLTNRLEFAVMHMYGLMDFLE